MRKIEITKVFCAVLLVLSLTCFGSENRALKPGHGGAEKQVDLSACGSKDKPGYDAIAVARWNVVPEREFQGSFEIGVLAFHLYGIDRVEFSAVGGDVVTVKKATQNPRTKTDEYWVKLDAKDFADGPIQLQAVAYPINGIPKQIACPVLYANSGGTLQFPVVELDKGSHHIDKVKAPKKGYLTYRPKPGVSRDECIIESFPRWKGGNVKFENLTIKGQTKGLSGIKACYKEYVWFDRANYVGKITKKEITPWTVHMVAKNFWTDCTIRNMQVAFLGKGLVRNCKVEDIAEDLCRLSGLIVNVEAERIGLNWGPHKAPHPDVFQWYKIEPENMIIYNVNVKRTLSQGLFPGDLKNVAIVKLYIDNRNDLPKTHFRALQMYGAVQNVLIQDSVFVGPGMLRPKLGFKALPPGLLFKHVLDGKGQTYKISGLPSKNVTVID